jgi:hypothetical protein
MKVISTFAARSSFRERDLERGCGYPTLANVKAPRLGACRVKQIGKHPVARCAGGGDGARHTDDVANRLKA